jgi:beta-glucosidase-like glycosyl hydrolase
LEGNAENPPIVPDLPRSGSQLAYVVQVLLKTHDEEKRDFLKHFIHRANVNRDEVVRCMLGMKARGHRAYVHVDEAKVRENQLPANGIPPESISLLPNDNSFEKLRVQKAATPVDAMKDADKIRQSFKDERPNAVVLERSSAEGTADFCDAFIGQTIAGQKLRTARAEVRLEDAGPGSCRCVSGLSCPNHVEFLLNHFGQERCRVSRVAHVFNIRLV